MIFWTLWSLALLVAFGGTRWSIHCSRTTLAELKWALARLSTEPDQLVAAALMLELSFERHYWRMLTLRNPWIGCSPELRAALGK